MAYLRSGIDGGRQSNSLVRNRVMDIRGDLATGGRLVLSTTEPTVVDGNELGRIDFQAPLDTGGTDAILVAASIYAEADATFSSSVNTTDLVFATGNSETAAEQMRLTSDGRLGIGTTAPDKQLEIAHATDPVMRFTRADSAIVDAENLGSIQFSGDDPDDSTGAIIQARAEGTWGTNDLPSALLFYTCPDGSGDVAERMRISSAGNVGIGEAAPSSKLEITKAAAGVQNLLKLNNNRGGSQADGDGCAILVEGAIADNADSTTYGKIECKFDDVSQTTIDSSWHFHNYVGNTATEVLSILAGKVGIGETAPSNLLSLKGASAGITVDDTGTNGGTFQLQAAAEDSVQTIHLYNNDNSKYCWQSQRITTTDTTYMYRLACGIDPQLADVNCGLFVRSHRYYVSGIVMKDGDTSTTYAATFMSFYRADTAVGTITTTGSTTAFNTSSDYRLKENVVAMSGSIDRLKLLNPSRFNFLNDTSRTVDGFLAHEAQEVVPEAIQGEKDAMTEAVLYVETDELPEGKSVGDVKTASVPDMQGIDQSKLVPLLVGALQETITRIETLENA